MREIVLDTETTGLCVQKGHRLIEIGCIELEDGVTTGRTFHSYMNPGRDVDPDAERVHGLNLSFLQQHPAFCLIAADFLKFIDQSPLVIHNARFDLSFLNSELQSIGKPPLSNPIVDTLLMARQKLPGAPASLDALCRHFGIDNTRRTYHGALLDAELLSQVYIELTGGKQKRMAFSSEEVQKVASVKTFRPPREFPPSEEERHAHLALLQSLKK
jgi:DNA polymerase-3 subunit epsilon